jgi:hypothetical protein
MNPTNKLELVLETLALTSHPFSIFPKLVEAIIRIIDAHFHAELEHTITISNRLEDGFGR